MLFKYYLDNGISHIVQMISHGLNSEHREFPNMETTLATSTFESIFSHCDFTLDGATLTR